MSRDQHDLRTTWVITAPDCPPPSLSIDGQVLTLNLDHGSGKHTEIRFPLQAFDNVAERYLQLRQAPADIQDVSDSMGSEQQQLADMILRCLSPQGHQGLTALTGAGPYAIHDNGVSFSFQGSEKANYVKILLDYGPDLFEMELGSVGRTGDYTQLTHLTGLFFDQLGEIFREHTGLETRMPTIYIVD